MESDFGERVAEMRAARRLALALGLAFAAITGAALAAIWWMADEYDSLAQMAAERMIGGGLGDLEGSLDVMIADYAIWTAAFEAASAGDESWLAENVGSGVYAGEGDIADVAIVLTPGGAEFGWTADTGATSATGLVEADVLSSLLARLRAVPADAGLPASVYARSGGGDWLFTSIRITPTEGAPEGAADEAFPRLVFGRALTSEAISAIGARFLIEDLALESEPPSDGRDSMPIPGADGETVFWIAWSPPATGAHVFRSLLPPALAALLLLALAGVLTARRLLSATERLQAALREANAAGRAKTAFLSNVSHELRTPMNGVLGAAELLRMKLTDIGARRLIDIISDSARHQLELINAILDHARIDGGARRLAEEPFDPSAELATVAAMLAPEAEAKGLTLDCAADPSPLVNGDALAFRQICVNLIGNAVKFTETGFVRAALETRRAGARIEIRLEVTDTGPGVPMGQREAIFRSFVRGEEAERRAIGGVGLGLSITAALVGMMEGSVAVGGEPGAGSVFTAAISLPPADETKLGREAA